MRQVIVIGLDALTVFLLLVGLWRFSSHDYPNFRGWWNGVGLMLFIMLMFLSMSVLIALRIAGGGHGAGSLYP